jgi:hypothetical protein
MVQRRLFFENQQYKNSDLNKNSILKRDKDIISECLFNSFYEGNLKLH